MNITLDQSTAQFVKDHAIFAEQSPDEVVIKAMRVLQHLMNQEIEAGIQRGLADIEAGRTIPLNKDNIDTVLDSILN